MNEGGRLAGVLLHEWLERSGGAENVFEAMRDAFPDAQSWCLWDDSDGRFPGVRETGLARWPLRRSKALSLPFMPGVWRTLPTSDADWMLVSSHLFAHHARFRGRAAEIPKFVYAHTPARYIWNPDLDRRGDSPFVRAAAALFKPLDRHRAQEATAIAANSRFVADRIAAAWDREATVIYPPVDTAHFGEPQTLSGRDARTLDGIPQGFLLAVSRWVPYKNLEAVIHAGEVTGRAVVIAGRGPDGPRLREIAAASRAHVTFVDFPSRPLLRALYQRAAAFVFTGIEDFGIVAVEAMASGTPVLVNAVGGAAESVIDGVTGAYVHEWRSPEQLRAALDTALRTDPEACRARAADFDRDVFVRRIRSFVLDDPSVTERDGGHEQLIGGQRA